MEIIKSYVQQVPATRFIGKKYGDADRVGGGFGKQWDEWNGNGLFAPIDSAAGDVSALFEDADATIGLMRWKKDEPFEYRIGKFTPCDTAVPEGYGFVDFPAAKLGVCWLYGELDTLFFKEHLAEKRLREQGYRYIGDEQGAFWFFERYALPRSTVPDEKGNVVLDIVFFVE